MLRIKAVLVQTWTGRRWLALGSRLILLAEEATDARLLKERAGTCYMLEPIMATPRFERREDLGFERPTSARENVVLIGCNVTFHTAIHDSGANNANQTTSTISSEHQSREEIGRENPTATGQGGNRKTDADGDTDMADAGNLDPDSDTDMPDA